MTVRKLLTLRSVLYEKGLSQVILAQTAGISRGYLSLAFSGRYNLSEEERTKIANALNESPEKLFPELQIEEES